MTAKDDSKCYELMLNYNCNAVCGYCSQGDFNKSLNASFPEIARNIYAAYKDGARRLGFSGGEPLISPHILRAVALAKSVGFRFIRVQTNGIRLADAEFCRKLARAGLTFCKFSLSSDRPEEHDGLLGVPGAWARAARGVENLRKLKLRLGNNILVSRLNYSRLPEIIHSQLELGLTNIAVIYPVYTGSMADNSGTLGVSLGECAKYFTEAAALMKSSGLENGIFFLNVPPCFLKGSESLAMGLKPFNTVVTDPLGQRTNLDETANLSKVRAPACKKCFMKAQCAGVDKRYARLFGFSGFRPVPKSAAARSAKQGRSRSVFLSDNELCIIEILKDGREASTRTVAGRAKNIVLCRDCTDGNSVLASAGSLKKKGAVTSRFSGGEYFWKLARPYEEMLPHLREPL